MKIRRATIQDAGILSGIIRRSYQTVADQFDLTINNCPKHPSNCVDAWVASDLERGIIYFLLVWDEKEIGCAALEKAGMDLCYLERLAVLPEYRNNGFGRKLVEHVFNEARQLGCAVVSIGMIAKQHELKNWYAKIGFKEGITKSFPHLPFDVTFMEFNLTKGEE